MAHIWTSESSEVGIKGEGGGGLYTQVMNNLFLVQGPVGFFISFHQASEAGLHTCVLKLAYPCTQAGSKE
jgi:hypothetical protein